MPKARSCGRSSLSGLARCSCTHAHMLRAKVRLTQSRELVQTWLMHKEMAAYCSLLNRTACVHVHEDDQVYVRYVRVGSTRTCSESSCTRTIGSVGQNFAVVSTSASTFPARRITVLHCIAHIFTSRTNHSFRQRARRSEGENVAQMGDDRRRGWFMAAFGAQA